MSALLIKKHNHPDDRIIFAQGEVDNAHFFVVQCEKHCSECLGDLPVHTKDLGQEYCVIFNYTIISVFLLPCYIVL